jgi:uncharacterized membrane protein
MRHQYPARVPATRVFPPTKSRRSTAGVGALAGILFPPSIIGSAIVGGTAGGVIGHLWRGMSRGDLEDLGEALDDGNAGLIVMGESRIPEEVEKATNRARKVLEKQMGADAAAVKKEIEAAEKQGG